METSAFNINITGIHQETYSRSLDNYKTGKPPKSFLEGAGWKLEIDAPAFPAINGAEIHYFPSYPCSFLTTDKIILRGAKRTALAIT